MTRTKSLFAHAAISLAGASALLTACTTEVDVPLSEGDTQGPADKFTRAQERIPGQYIVVLNSSDEKDAGARARVDVPAVADNLGAVYAASVGQVWSDSLHGFTAQMTEQDAIALASDPTVATVEEDFVVHADVTQNNAVPGLDRIDQAALPLNGAYNFNADGTGVTAFIIDTGMRVTHTEFAGRVNTSLGRNFVDNDVGGNRGLQGFNDGNGHGTHVAGTIGGKTFGVAKGVTLVPVRVLNDAGSGSGSAVINGINYVAKIAKDNRLNAVANMSLGGGFSQTENNAVAAAIRNGVVFALAAGNENADACTTSPASEPTAITVGAMNPRNDTRSSFSNFGRCVDIFAPGEGILSSSNGSDNATATLAGTSMATPHVVGAAALFRSANPGATPADVAAALTSNASANQLKALKTDDPNKLLFTGFIGNNGNPNPNPNPDPQPNPGGKKNVVSRGFQIAQGAVQNFSAAGLVAGTDLLVTLSGSGDADLFVTFGNAAIGNNNTERRRAACISNGNTSTETCTLKVPAGNTTAQIQVLGFSNANVTLTATFFR